MSKRTTINALLSPTITARVLSVEIDGDDTLIHLQHGQDTPYIQVTPDEYIGMWPPQIGDIVTITVPQVVAINRPTT